MMEMNFVTMKRNTRELTIKHVILVVANSISFPDEREYEDKIRELDMSLYCINCLSVYGMNKTNIIKTVKRYCRNNNIQTSRGDLIIYTNEVLSILGGGG